MVIIAIQEEEQKSWLKEVDLKGTIGENLFPEI